MPFANTDNRTTGENSGGLVLEFGSDPNDKATGGNGSAGGSSSRSGKCFQTRLEARLFANVLGMNKERKPLGNDNSFPGTASLDNHDTVVLSQFSVGVVVNGRAGAQAQSIGRYNGGAR